jgi:SAM-dependent methyltransferase
VNAPPRHGQRYAYHQNRLAFYRRVVSSWVTDRDASILVVGGGLSDATVFQSLGFSDVTISNLDSRVKGKEFSPYAWSFQNAESLDFDDNSFDFVVVHAALHHCSSPHRALLEMYRTARCGAIFFESRDSILMRMLEVFKLTSTYETVAVYDNDGQHGGVNNTDIPNFVFRWTEREVEKTVSSYAPYARHKFQYAYGTDDPHLASREKRGGVKLLVSKLVSPVYRVFVRLFPKQQNLFACMIGKPNFPNDLFDWISFDAGSIKFNRRWSEKIYKSALFGESTPPDLSP